MAIQSDGKIVIAGSAQNGTYRDIALVRYDPDGALDTTFDGDGIVIEDVSPYEDVANSVAIQPDGKVVAGGHVAGDLAVLRWDSGGSLDPAFDLDGVATVDYCCGSVPTNGVSIQTDGKIVAIGEGGAMWFARFNVDGTLDTTFGGGFFGVNVSGYNHSGHAITIQPDGKIVGVGISLDSDQDPSLFVAVARLDGGPSLCGNGLIDAGEFCDDAGESASCDADCTLAACGDAEPNQAAGEQCDVGPPTIYDCCTAACSFLPAATACEDANPCTVSDSCNATGTCEPGGKATCVGGFEKATLLIDERKPGREKLKAKFKRGPAVAKEDFGDPMDPGGTAYLVCLFDDAGEYVGQLDLDRAGFSCKGRPCWKDKSQGYH